MNRKKIVRSLILVFFVLNNFSLFAQNDSTQKSRSVLRGQNIVLNYADVTSSVFVYYQYENGKKIPVFDTIEYGKSTFVGLMVDKNYYNLKESLGVRRNYKTEKRDFIVEYVINKKINFNIVYTILDNNTLEIKYVISNFDDVEHEVSFKSIFDTVLNDKSTNDFFTVANKSINSEYIISDLKKHQRLASTDGIVRIDFVLNDELANNVYKVVIASKPYLMQPLLDTFFTEGRGFNTLLSYNNSAVGFFFNSITLPPLTKKTYSQKIIFSAKAFPGEDLGKLKTYDYSNVELIYGSDSKVEEKKDSSIATNQVQEKKEVPVITAQSTTQQTTQTQEKKVEPQQIIVIQNQKKNFDKARALALIQKIRQLRDDGSDISKEELNSLQTQLDEIFYELKSE